MGVGFNVANTHDTSLVGDVLRDQPERIPDTVELRAELEELRLIRCGCEALLRVLDRCLDRYDGVVKSHAHDASVTATPGRSAEESSGLLSPHGLYLRPEFFELRDYSRESVLRVRQADRKHPLRVRVAAHIAKGLHRAAVAVDRFADKARLRLRVTDVAQDVSVPVAGPGAATPRVPAATVAEATDILSPDAGAADEAVEPVPASSVPGFAGRAHLIARTMSHRAAEQSSEGNQ